MNEYNNNNYSRASGTDSTTRFKKRPRYATTSSGGNNSPRYKYQNQSGYQYSPNRNCASDSFQHNQYEKNASRYFYSHSPKRSNYNPQQSNKQSTNYSHKQILSPSSTSSASAQNINLSPQSDRLPTKTASATTAQNNQRQQPFAPNIVENTNNYYGYPFNFYSTTYNADYTPSAAPTAYGVVDGMSSYLWQTITSTPPPKLPQQQPPLPLQQPPALPPLPSPERPHLPPPPPIPSSVIDSASTPAATEYDQKKSYLQDSGAKTIVRMKTKRKAMSMRYKLSKSWSEKDALLALKAEQTNTRKLQKDFILIIRFPDPEINREIVKNYSPDIESVHFQLNFAPRYCLIHLKPGTDVDKTIDHLSKIQFGSGYLSAEIKQISHKAHSTRLDEIDPFTLYVGNLPTTIACKTIKEHFPGAARIDIGFSQRMKYTRYAYIRYQNVHLAIAAYKRMLDAEIGGRTLTIRFRRLTTASEGNKDADVNAENNVDLHDDLISQNIVDESEGNLTELTQHSGDDVGTIANPVDENTANDDFGNRKNKKTDKPSQQEISYVEDNLTETIARTVASVNSNIERETISQQNSNTSLLDIKPEPDVDPNDVVIRYNTIGNRYDNNDSSIKQEQENLALYEEFFERPQNQNDTGETSNRSNRNSLTSTTDDTDTMSQLSSNGLGEFLQICRRPQKEINSNVKDAEQPTKKNNVTIKTEPLEKDKIANKENSSSTSKDTASKGSVKQEAEEEIIESLNASVESICSNNCNTVRSSRKRAYNIDTSEDSCNNTSNIDDIVPPTALFFTSDYHHKWANSRNNCDKEDCYDEFYGTRSSAQSSSSQAKFKTEPLDISISKSTNERNEKSQQEKPQNRSSSVRINNICIEKSNRNLTTTSNAVDDDSVPAQNLLGSYRPHRNVVKQETEYDDLFSVPFSITSKSNTDVDEAPPTYSTSQICECPKVPEVLKSHVGESNDDDVVVVSASIPPASKKNNSDYSVYNNLVVSRLTDLVSFNYKPIAVPLASREVSTLLIRDHLDELYDQLDADSDSEL